MSKLNKKVYKVRLYKIDKNAQNSEVKKDAKVAYNLFMCDNISICDLLVYDAVTSARELITGKKIPYFCEGLNGKFIYRGGKSDRVFFELYNVKLKNLIVGLDEIEAYLEEKLDPKRYNLDDNYVSKKELRNKYLEELNDIFNSAYEDYNEVLEYSSYSSEYSKIKYERKNNKRRVKELTKKYF